MRFFQRFGVAPRKSVALIVAVLSPLSLSACQTTDIANSIGGATQLASTLDTSAERQRQLALQGEQQILKEKPVSRDKALESYLNKMANDMARASSINDYQYNVRLIEDAAVNAFTTGAGRLFVTTGLVKALDNEAQMAAVLSHEMAHVTESHVVRGMRDKTAILVGAQAGAAALGANQNLLAQAAYKYAVSAAVNGHGRGFETDADVVGLKYLVAAGYDAREAPKVFEKFIKLYGDQSKTVNFFHGGHPRNVERIATLKKELSSTYRGKNFANARRNTRTYANLTARYKP